MDCFLFLHFIMIPSFLQVSILTDSQTLDSIPSRSKSIDRSQTFGVDENKDRGNWTGRMDFLLSMLGLVFWTLLSYSIYTIFRIICRGSVFGPFFNMQYYVYFLVLQSSWFGRERELVALFWLSYWCLVTVSVLWVFLTVPWVGLQGVIMIFSDHAHLSICLVIVLSIFSSFAFLSLR